MFLLDIKNKIPLYRQLYQQLRAKILSGELCAQSKLVSSRRLSTELGISRNTVDLAYQQLLSEGYIIGKPRSGYYVEALHNTILPPLANLPQTETMSESPPETNRYDFTYGKLSPHSFPFSQWQKLTNQCLRNDQNDLLSYPSFMGEIGLRKEILNYLRDYRDIKCTIEQILITSGTQHGLDLASQLLKPLTSAIAMEDPGFAGAYRTFMNQGFCVHPIPINHHGLNVKALYSSIAKAVYVTPSHQFPTGRIMSITRRLRLIEWAYEKNAFIIEDDYSSHLRYNVKPIASLQGLAPDKVIYIGSFSKVLLPSLRVAYMVLPKDLAQQIQQMSPMLPCSVPFLIQKPLELLLKEGHFESHLRKMLRILKRKHDLLIHELKENFGDNLSITGMNAGLHLLLQLKSPIFLQDLTMNAAKLGVNISAKNKLWTNSEHTLADHILLGFGGIALEDIPAAVALLRKAWLDRAE